MPNINLKWSVPECFGQHQQSKARLRKRQSTVKLHMKNQRDPAYQSNLRYTPHLCRYIPFEWRGF